MTGSHITVSSQRPLNTAVDLAAQVLALCGYFYSKFCCTAAVEIDPAACVSLSERPQGRVALIPEPLRAGPVQQIHSALVCP